MDVDALLEAFQDFEKKVKKETCPVLEQFLCHVAKTGQPLILWSQLKEYFMFKLENVMDDFHSSTPEQRASHNPNVEHVPFEEMKKRILKIVDGYNGIPFTIQRLCELLMDPNRNYVGTDKFLRGLEKNVRVVSCVYPMSEKNGASSVNRMNGVMFPGNSTLYSDSRNVNGPDTPRPLNRPKLSLSTSLSTNGLPDCPVGKEPEPTTEEVEHHMSDSPPSEAEVTTKTGTKTKRREEEEEVDDDADRQEVKRLKFDEKEEEETEKKESSCRQGSESLSEMSEPLAACGQDKQSGTSCDTTCDHEPSSTRTETSEREGSSSETGDVPTKEEEEDESTGDDPEPPAPLEESTSFEQDNEESRSGVCDGEDPASDKEVPSSSSSSPDLTTEGDADNSYSTDTAIEPGEQHE